MKKFNLFFLLAMLALCSGTATADVVFDETNFPDEDFREAIADAFWDDYDIRLNDGDILTDEMLNMRIDLGADDYGIHSVQGIEYLAGLYTANLDMNQIEEIDLSHNHLLRVISLSRNPLRSINLSGCQQLDQLFIGPWPNQPGELAELDLSDCTNLTLLELYDEPVENLDLTHNTLLQSISLQGISLFRLDLSASKNLQLLGINNCPDLSSITFYQPTFSNPIDIGLGIQEIYLSNLHRIKEINLSGQIYLNYFNIFDCDSISSIDFSDCISLKKLNIQRCASFQSHDLSGCTSLEELSILNCPKYEILDVSDVCSLKQLVCMENNTKRIIGLENSSAVLEYANLFKNRLTSLNLQNFTRLNVMGCIISHNSLNCVDLSGTNIVFFENENESNGRQIKVYSTEVDGELRYYIPIETTATQKGIKDLIEQENNYEDEDTGFDWADVVTESITGATLSELDGEQVFWLDATTTGASEGLHRMTYQYVTHCPNTNFATTEFYLDWAEESGKAGDVNGDGNVNTADIAALINYLLTQDDEGINRDNADVNGDDSINIGDVSSLIGILLTGNND